MKKLFLLCLSNALAATVAADNIAPRGSDTCPPESADGDGGCPSITTPPVDNDTYFGNVLDVGGAIFEPVRYTAATTDLQEQMIDGNGNRQRALLAKGSSYLSYFGLGICSAVLYLDQSAPNDAVRSLHGSSSESSPPPESSTMNTPVALEISYHKPVTASNFRWATRHYSEKNGHTADHIKELVNTFNDLYHNVKRGDRYLLEYNPEEGNGTGVSLSLNGNVLGSVGVGSPHLPEFAQAIYSIWFGEKPFFEKLKNDLLTPLDT